MISRKSDHGELPTALDIPRISSPRTMKAIHPYVSFPQIPVAESVGEKIQRSRDARVFGVNQGVRTGVDLASHIIGIKKREDI